jgi:peptide/nickel transport system permease protein
MIRILARRLGGAAVTAFLVVTLVFVAMRLLPGDPVIAMLGDSARAADIEAARSALGLDRPLIEQYLGFLAGLLQGDLGISLINRTSVIEQLLRALPYTLTLTAAAELVGLAAGIPLGVLAAMRRGGAADGISRGVALVGFAVPDFYLGVILLLVFGLWLGWFPLIGGGETLPAMLHSLVLPACALGLVKAASMTRLTRAAMLDALGRDYMRTARAKGLPERAVIGVHAFRNALLPILTQSSQSIIATLGGSIAIELVFSRPGIGKLLIGAVIARDYVTIQGGLVVLAVLVVLVNLLTDLAYAAADPRVRLA